jgi:hypothetical protein
MFLSLFLHCHFIFKKSTWVTTHPARTRFTCFSKLLLMPSFFIFSPEKIIVYAKTLDFFYHTFMMVSAFRSSSHDAHTAPVFVHVTFVGQLGLEQAYPIGFPSAPIPHTGQPIFTRGVFQTG